MKSTKSLGKKLKISYSTITTLFIMIVVVFVNSWDINELNNNSGTTTSKSMNLSSENIVPTSSLTSFQYENHSPIFIDGNFDFIAQAEANQWPGEGTPLSPYVIDGYNIIDNFPSLIIIRYTDVHFQISNCFLSQGGINGICLSHVINGQLFNNTVNNSREDGIFVIDGSENNTISGNIVSNNNGHGISVVHSGNSVFSGNTVANNSYDGIHLFHSGNSVLSGNTVANNSHDGITLLYSENSTLSENTVASNKIDGITLLSSENSTLTGNTVANHSYDGITLGHSGNSILSDNILENNGLHISGYALEDYLQAAVTNNSMNGKVLVYWCNITGETVPSGAGHVILVFCNSVKVTDQHLQGVHGIHSSNLVITNNSITNGSQGIVLVESESNTLSANTITNNLGNGISLDDSQNNTLVSNTISDNYGNGLCLDRSENNTFSDNTIANNSGDGITLDDSEYNTFSGNTIINNANHGICFQYVSVSNALSGNIVTNNRGNGIFIYASGESVLTGNSIVNNSGDGIYLGWSESSTLSDNTIAYNSGDGISLDHSGNSILSSNTISDNNGNGMCLDGSKNNRILDNILVNNSLNFIGSSLHGYDLEAYLQAEVANNSINGKALIYWRYITGETVPSGVGQVILVYCNSVEVTGQHLIGVQGAYCSNLFIHSNIISNGSTGIALISSGSNTLSNNVISNGSIGIALVSSESNTLSNNIISNGSMGIALVSSGRNSLANNTIVNNSEYGIYIDGGSNAIFNNTIANNSDYGIYIDGGSHNKIMYNDFSRNNPGCPQAYDAPFVNIGEWCNNSFKYNCWDEWISPDNDMDGIVDSPYQLAGPSVHSQHIYPKNQDPYPLVRLKIPRLPPSTVIYPNGGEILSGITIIEWTTSTGPWDRFVIYTVCYSADGGVTWITLKSEITTSSYAWDTTTVTDGNNYLIQVKVGFSEAVWKVDTSDSTFVIDNPTITTSMTIATSIEKTSSGTPFIPISLIILPFFVLYRRKKR